MGSSFVFAVGRVIQGQVIFTKIINLGAGENGTTYDCQ